MVHTLLTLTVAVLGILCKARAAAPADEPWAETLPMSGLTEGTTRPEELLPPGQMPGIPAAKPDEPAAPEPPETPELSADDWNLILANPWNRLPEDYTVALRYLNGGHAVDERAYPDLQRMMDDCRAAGLSPLICSSYRTWEKQESLYERKIQRLMAEHGYSREVAAAEAAKVVAVPGTSEHQTGLALDIVDVNYQVLDEAQENTPAQQWLMEHSWEYGFILRYPNGKSDVTGIIYEPWHYRYVGRDAAREIHDRGITLEEYLNPPASAAVET